VLVSAVLVFDTNCRRAAARLAARPRWASADTLPTTPRGRLVGRAPRWLRPDPTAPPRARV